MDVDAFRGFCYVCKQQGHRARDCPSSKGMKLKWVAAEEGDEQAPQEQATPGFL